MITKLGKAENQFMLFGKNGAMQQLERVKLSRGVKITAIGYAGFHQYFVVFEDGKAVEICTDDPNDVSEFDLGAYFSPITRYEETIRPISQQFGIGLYYDESGEIVSEEVIEKSLLRAQNIEALKKSVEERKKKQAEETRARLLKEYDYLQRAKDRYDRKVVGGNIRAELARNFPGIKFSVRYKSFSGNNEYRISWVDGPTKNQVEKIVDKYSDMRPDPLSMGDYWDSCPTIFNELYGSVGYIITDRDAGSDFEQKMLAKYPGLTEDNFRQYHDCYDGELFTFASERANSLRDVLRRLWYKTDLTPEIEKSVPKAKAKEIVSGEFKIIDYSEKAIALVGDTKAVKDTLKKIGGRFNPRLSCGAGWIFSKKKDAELRSALGMA